MANKKITINELRSLVKQHLNEGIPMGQSKLAQDTANKLNFAIGKMNNPDLEGKARALAGQLIQLLDQDQSM